MNKIEQHKKALLEALESSLGVVTSACKKVGVGRTTFYNYVNADEEFAKAVQDIDNVALDFAESQLHQQIKTGNATSTIFYLKTKGKKRGYVERMENVNTNKNFDLSKLTDEELAEELRQAKRVLDE
tara:strand:- start:1042 stop:1422 length:381 start_codon:yes stop_codon:yes gene_type:complete